MRATFDTITDWIGIPLFLVAIVMLVRADLISVRSPAEVGGSAYQLARQAGAVAGVAAVLLALVRFAVLATG